MNCVGRQLATYLSLPKLLLQRLLARDVESHLPHLVDLVHPRQGCPVLLSKQVHHVQCNEGMNGLWIIFPIGEWQGGFSAYLNRSVLKGEVAKVDTPGVVSITIKVDIAEREARDLLLEGYQNQRRLHHTTNALVLGRLDGAETLDDFVNALAFRPAELITKHESAFLSCA